MMDGNSDVRASDSEREASVAALSAHVESRRLSLDEFDRRVATANAAEFRGELTALFGDLPEPHPRFDDPSAEIARKQDTSVARPVETSVVRREDMGLLRAAAYSLFPVSGIIAIALIILTGWWIWLLIVPPAAYFARDLAKRTRRPPRALE